MKTQDEKTKTEFKVERSKYKTQLYWARRKYLQDLFEDCHNDTSKLYNLVSSLTGNKMQNPLPEGTPEYLVEGFANFFINKIQKIRDDLDKYEQYQPKERFVNNKLRKLSIVTSSEVEKALHGLKSKQCELDIIPTKFLKTSKDLLTVVTHIVNLSFNENIFAEEWKEALLKPLLKKPNLELEMRNFRPVSNLPFLSKVVEKVALGQLNEHLHHNAELPDHMSAYRQHRSCETVLLKVINDILWSMEESKINAFVAIDLSAAFDTVDHDTLLNIMDNQFGIIDEAKQWFESYLHPRGFRVKIEDHTSSRRDLPFSVPQGSISGPTLFNLYASTLGDSIQDDITLNGFADDHTLQCQFQPGTVHEDRAIVSLQETLININEWMNLNRLKMNPDKTEYILFGSRQQLCKITSNGIIAVDKFVARSECIKYLGALLDMTLSFEEHVNHKCKIASWNLQKLRKLRPYMDSETCKRIVQSLVISHLDYANCLLVNITKKQLNKLQRVQNRAAKMVLNRSKFESATRARFDLHWLPIPERIEFKILMIVYKCVNGMGPDYLMKLFVKDEQKYKTRRSGIDNCNLQLPFTKRKTFADRAISVAGPKMWNKLPLAIRKNVTVEGFKKDLKTYLFKRAYSDLIRQ